MNGFVYFFRQGVYGCVKKVNNYITMLLLDLKLDLAHEEEMMNTREVAE